MCAVLYTYLNPSHPCVDLLFSINKLQNLQLTIWNNYQFKNVMNLYWICFRIFFSQTFGREDLAKNNFVFQKKTLKRKKMILRGSKFGGKLVSGLVGQPTSSFIWKPKYYNNNRTQTKKKTPKYWNSKTKQIETKE